MSTATSSIPAFGPASLPMPTAALEVLGYLTVVGVGTLCFLLGWLQPNGAAVLTVLLLSSLIVLAWKRFDQGRHPCFLFLCVLMFFQGGRLLAYCFGAETEPLRIMVMVSRPFNVSRDEAGIVLLCLVLSAICIYAPCRWNYRWISPPADAEVRHYLPYLYFVFFITLPIQLFKNYSYYQYAQAHGGYTFLFVNHAALAASVPFLVRATQLITFPVFVAIFVFERRKKFLYPVTILYFCTAAIILLLGSRVGAFSLVLALWYIARVKSTKKARILRLAIFALLLMMVGYAVQQIREDSGEQTAATFSPARVLDLQGASLDVTAVAVKYRKLFRPYVASYLLQELRDAFVANDAANYYRGRALGFDVTVLLNPALFSMGYGTGSSYVAEAYVIGGLLGVVLISVLMGFGLGLLYDSSRKAISLFVVAMVLPDILIMPRNGLLDWMSALLRSGVAILVLVVGWQLYSFIFPSDNTPAGQGLPPTTTVVS